MPITLDELTGAGYRARVVAELPDGRDRGACFTVVLSRQP